MRLVRAKGGRRVAPKPAIAIDEDNPAQHASVIDPRLTMGLGKEGSKTSHLRVGQPEEIAPFSEA